jgi:hypothetical protein
VIASQEAAPPRKRLPSNRVMSLETRRMRAFLAYHFTTLGQKLIGLRGQIPELDSEAEDLLAAARGLSMTAPIAQWELIQAIRYIEGNGIAGDVVECGVWRGGNLVIAGLLRERMGFERQIWAFDTFAGMTPPSAADFKVGHDVDVGKKFADLDREDHNEWCLASEQEVLQNFESRVGNRSLRTVRGPVEETLTRAEDLPEQIALLRLDTDFY